MIQSGLLVAVATLAVGLMIAFALRAEVAKVFATQTMAHWTAAFEGVDACVTPVLRLDELAQHPVHSTAARPS